MAITRTRLTKLRRTGAYRASVWLRRLAYLCTPVWVIAVFVVGFVIPWSRVLGVSVMAGPIVPIILMAQGWHVMVRRAGVRERRIGVEPKFYMDVIEDPVVRRQHLRDVFWLPLRW